MRQRFLLSVALLLGLIGLIALVYLRPWETPRARSPAEVPAEVRGTAAAGAAPVVAMQNSRPEQDIAVPRHAGARRTVRVAAIQMASELGRVNSNRERMSTLAHQAASLGAQMIVFPECALQGYMDVPGNRVWTKEKEDSGNPDVALVASPLSGAFVRHFRDLARERKIYLALPFIESEGETYFNALVLIDPAGQIAASHRKHSPWPPGDATWMSAGSGKAAVAQTPFGRVGLMICHDLHTQPPVLKKARADLVLYAVGWYGPNVENWYRDLFPRRYVVPNGFAVVAANWALPPGAKDWGGAGYSCVIDRNGGVVAMAKTPTDEEIVVGDIEVGVGEGEEVEEE